ncbi:LlsX family protein [Levilactobacillus lindianensis]|uniref:LlsX family protein n=1 Tax=Levilactobacillus lindianensis TaxID=2486018 RepID=UPI000F73BB72|nr:LlsX family protein [Levilactobacillus lindianensis]
MRQKVMIQWATWILESLLLATLGLSVVIFLGYATFYATGRGELTLRLGHLAFYRISKGTTSVTGQRLNPGMVITWLGSLIIIMGIFVESHRDHGRHQRSV